MKIAAGKANDCARRGWEMVDEFVADGCQIADSGSHSCSLFTSALRSAGKVRC